jgi:hypothetical protein
MQARNKHKKLNCFTLLTFLKNKEIVLHDEKTHTHTQPAQKNDSENDNAQMMKTKK